MTNEELDKARVKEAQRLFLDGSDESPTILIAARLAREGWMPPEPVDPDLNMARDYAHYLLGTIFEVPSFQRAQDYFLQAIKQGRALAAEAKPRLVWVKHDGSTICPVDPNSYVWIKRGNPSYVQTTTCYADAVGWYLVTHYAVITPPEDK